MPQNLYLLSLALATASLVLPVRLGAVPAPLNHFNTEFVKTVGTQFTLDGSKFTVVGGNAYWVGLKGLSVADMNKAFADIAKAGGTTVRTWGFNEATTPSGIYYQSWSEGVPTINTGSTGLGNFDNVVAAAKANNIRLIVALTNNWADYGGMDVYVNQIIGNGQPHDYFYTNEKVLRAYKNYVQTFVSRYVNEPTIMAWELANEPRCRGTTTAISGNCTTATVTHWAYDISAFIKSIDKNHLVALGDEGFFSDPTSSLYPYQGTQGVDFAVNIKIETLDFGTFHLYPEYWVPNDEPIGFGNKWITDHVAQMKTNRKPVILEEFGVTDIKSTAYPSWFSTVISSGLTGDLIWQSGSNLTNGPTPDDGFTIYPNDPTYSLLASHAAALKAGH